ncbi:MAG TPA: response regulator [Candidatus Binatia bacterium]|nr:response regulator [Candidatus Binatia bacterium]
MDRIPQLPRQRVLIVDDNQDHLKLLATLLESLDQDVKTANNGPAAIWLAASFEPDVIFLDLSMPRMHGHDVARAIRKQPAGKAPQIFAITGFDSEADRDDALAAGCDDLLRKPARLEDLLLVLQGQRPGRRAASG